MPKLSAHDAALALLAAALIFVVLVWRLGTPTFWDPDEAHYAETTREMIATGDWSAPFYNEQPFFDKPVLFHQLQATAMQLVSDPEAGARLVPALAALVLVAITVWFGAVMLSGDAAIVAGLILMACPGLFGLARYAILDTLFTMFTFGGAACLAVAALRDRPRLQWVGYVAIALGVQVKGPIALVLCGLTMLILMAVSADLRRRLLRLRWVLGLVIIAAVSAPWFIYMYLRFKDGFVNGYVLDENVRLFAGARFGNQPGYGFYFQILAAALLPWTGLLVGRLVDDVRALRRGEQLDAVEIVLWSWTLAIVGFFTLSTFKPKRICPVGLSGCTASFTPLTSAGKTIPLRDLAIVRRSTPAGGTATNLVSITDTNAAFQAPRLLTFDVTNPENIAKLGEASGGAGKRRLTIPVDACAPGEELQLDTGVMGMLEPGEDGKRRRLKAFIFTSVCTRHRFVYPVFTECTPDAIEACEEAWKYFGGIFRAIIPDNTSAIVSKADPLDPVINLTFQEYAQKRGFFIDPTRVRSPQDKGGVERAVQSTRDDCFAGEKLHTLEDARRRAME